LRRSKVERTWNFLIRASDFKGSGLNGALDGKFQNEKRQQERRAHAGEFQESPTKDACRVSWRRWRKRSIGKNSEPSGKRPPPQKKGPELKEFRSKSVSPRGIGKGGDLCGRGNGG